MPIEEPKDDALATRFQIVPGPGLRHIGWADSCLCACMTLEMSFKPLGYRAGQGGVR